MASLNIPTSLRWSPFIPVLVDILRNPDSSPAAISEAIGHLSDLATKADKCADMIEQGKLQLVDAGPLLLVDAG